MEVYKKILEARKLIKASDLKKKGYNTFSNYSYYTPDQVHDLVHECCVKLNLLEKFDLKKDENGHYGLLKIIDLESGKELVFEMRTDIPEIKATNVAQQLGGAMTYTHRYLLMNVFGITDNTLDPDANDNRKKVNSANDDKKWLNKFDKAGNEIPEYKKIIAGAREKKLQASDLRNYYKINKETFEHVKKDML